MVTTQEQAKLEQAAQLRRAGVPDVIARRLAEPLDQTEALRAADEWHAGTRSTLLLAGGVGSGKTLAAAKTIAEHFDVLRPWLREKGDMPPTIRWRSAFFVSLEWLTDRSLFQEDDRLARMRALETSLLVLDDVGTERGDGEAALRDLLSTRMAAGRRTVLTTNLSGAVFSERYRERIMSRIRGEGVIVQCGRVDLRTAPKLVGADLAQPQEREPA